MNEAGAKFEGHAFHSGRSQAEAGTITVGLAALRFDSESCHLEFPFRDMQIRLNQNGDWVFFHHPQFPGWSISTPDEEILQHEVFIQRAEFRNQLQKLQQRSIWRTALIATLVFVACVALLFAGLSWASGRMVRFAVNKIPPTWEQKIGDEAFAEIETEEVFIEDAELLAQVRAACAPLTNVVRGLELKFHVAEDRDPNAFALPGGHVIVNTALLKMVDRPEELAGVLAHEIAHVTQKHGFRKIISAAGPYLIIRVFFGDSGGLFSLIANGSGMLLIQNYSRSYEREADDAGWNYLVSANIDPSGTIDFLKKIQMRHEKMGLDRLERSAWSSHPPTPERIKRLEEKWKKLKRKTGFIDLTQEGTDPR